MAKILADVPLYYHEVASCLYYVLGSVFKHHGYDRLELALGAVWDFFFREGEEERYEFCFPGPGATLAENLFPYLGVEADWRLESDPARAWQAVKERLDGGEPVVVAVDNFYLPFRPAFGDVHTNHLLVVYGYDEAQGLACVLDATPPAYKGPLGLEDLDRARGSLNPRECDRHMFFAQTPIAYRWLDMRFPPQPRRVDEALMRQALADNLARMRALSDKKDLLLGLAGIRDLAGRIRALARPDGLAGAVEEAEEITAFIFGRMLGPRTLHADFLYNAACVLGDPRVRRAARDLEIAAHSWVAARIMLGKGCKGDLADMAGRVAQRVEAIADREEAALEQLEAAAG